jgi:hypothetical protein
MDNTKVLAQCLNVARLNVTAFWLDRLLTFWLSMDYYDDTGCGAPNCQCHLVDANQPYSDDADNPYAEAAMIEDKAKAKAKAKAKTKAKKVVKTEAEAQQRVRRVVKAKAKSELHKVVKAQQRIRKEKARAAARLRGTPALAFATFGPALPARMSAVSSAGRHQDP